MKSLILALMIGIFVPSFAQDPHPAIQGACAIPGFPGSCILTDKGSCRDMQGAFMGGQCTNFKKDDIVLFPSFATSGRAFRMTRAIQRVGLVQTVESEKVIVQEINYFTRQGGTVWIQTPEGEKKYEGTHEVETAKLVPLVNEVTADDGTIITRGSRHPIRIGRTRVSGHVVYVFKNEEGSYAAVTTEKGWQCYTKFGEDCHTKEYMQLIVRTINSSR